MGLERIPRLALTHISAALAGFILAMWCLKTEGALDHFQMNKPGFILALRNKRKSSGGPSEHARDLWIQRTAADKSPSRCIKHITGAKVRISYRFTQIFGPLDHLTQVMPWLEEIDHGRAFIIQPEDGKEIDTCQELPLVEYGAAP